MHLKKEEKTLPFAGRDAYDLNDLNCFYSMKMVRYEKAIKCWPKKMVSGVISQVAMFMTINAINESTRNVEKERSNKMRSAIEWALP